RLSAGAGLTSFPLKLGERGDLRLLSGHDPLEPAFSTSTAVRSDGTLVPGGPISECRVGTLRSAEESSRQVNRRNVRRASSINNDTLWTVVVVVIDSPRRSR